MARKVDVYQKVTDLIIQRLEEGVVPWQRPWSSNSARAPQNFTTRRPYRGVNVFLTLAAGYDCPFWATYRQIAERGGQVKKGERGTTIVYWLNVEKEKEVNGKIVNDSFMIPKYSTVFNLRQQEGIEIPAIPDVTITEHEANENAERIMDGYFSTGPSWDEHGSAAFYRPSSDHITLPPRETFTSADGFYSTAFHEMVHSTGHESRLNRLTPATFGSHEYGREELVAEMGAAFLAAEAGIVTTVNNSAAYLQSWIDTIREDTKAIVWAASRAQAAAEFIIGPTEDE